MQSCIPKRGQKCLFLIKFDTKNPLKCQKLRSWLRMTKQRFFIRRFWHTPFLMFLDPLFGPLFWPLFGPPFLIKKSKNPFFPIKSSLVFKIPPFCHTPPFWPLFDVYNMLILDPLFDIMIYDMFLDPFFGPPFWHHHKHQLWTPVSWFNVWWSYLGHLFLRHRHKLRTLGAMRGSLGLGAQPGTGSADDSWLNSSWQFI